MKGFTLIEVLVTTVILTFIIAGIFAVLNVADMNWHSDMGLLDLQQQARQAMDVMVKEIRQSTQDTSLCPSGITRANLNAKISFYVVPQIYGGSCVGPISYYRDTQDLNYDGVTDQLIREYPQNTRKILANGITTLSFPPNSDINIVNIQLAAQKNIGTRQLCFPSPCQAPPKTFNETVKLRN